jgi:beta-glucuronidase
MSHRVFDRVDAVIGEQVWIFADFATSSRVMGSTATKGRVDPRPVAQGQCTPVAAAGGAGWANQMESR